jgi:hypothetical protein
LHITIWFSFFCHEQFCQDMCAQVELWNWRVDGSPIVRPSVVLWIWFASRGLCFNRMILFSWSLFCCTRAVSLSYVPLQQFWHGKLSVSTSLSCMWRICPQSVAFHFFIFPFLLYFYGVCFRCLSFLTVPKLCISILLFLAVMLSHPDVEKVCQFARVSLWGKKLHCNMGS